MQILRFYVFNFLIFIYILVRQREKEKQTETFYSLIHSPKTCNGSMQEPVPSQGQPSQEPEAGV